MGVERSDGSNDDGQTDVETLDDREVGSLPPLVINGIPLPPSAAVASEQAEQAAKPLPPVRIVVRQAICAAVILVCGITALICAFAIYNNHNPGGDAYTVSSEPSQAKDVVLGSAIGSSLVIAAAFALVLTF